ncbi:MAG: helix-hairpin-helix domain-containing protein [Kofleriaceae bacterium]|nr:helix-hairpin-helix domain-containing protein [Kofleriaceae bacterium]MCL4225192.1 helix-hairpin-helix domain-containing protein [Myxococcales bacterium]
MLKRILLATLALTLAATPAVAIPYEAFIDVDTDDDLDDLLASGQITPETYDALRVLLDRGVDLDTATREELYSLPNLTYADADAIIEYRALNGFIADPVDLVAAGVLTEEKLLAISSFLIIRRRERSKYEPHGFVRVFTRAAHSDRIAPPVGVRARVTAGKDLTAGLALSLTRLRVGEVVWDPNRDALLADPASNQLHVPKAFVRYRTDQLDLIAGTYRVGFGERLTFDTATDYTPNGLYLDDQLTRGYDLVRSCRQSTGELAATPCGGDLRYRYVTPDFGWSEGLRGLAVGTEQIPLGQGRLQAFGWGSYQHRSIYQYELANTAPGVCDDPRDDANPACSAPDVYVRPDGAPLTPAPEFSYQTLPNMFAESLVGGNVTYFAARRDYVGVTAYGATTTWLPDTPADVRLDTQEWSRWPIGGRHGAVGAMMGMGRGIYDVFAEVTHSFDRIPRGPGPVHGGGGPAAILRATRNLKDQEVEVSARYYDPDFANPYAGSIAAADEVEGQRARGEHGARLRYTGRHGAIRVRTGLDVWRTLVPIQQQVAGEIVDDFIYVARGDVYVRTDFDATRQFRWGVWLQATDKGLDQGDRRDAGGMVIPPCYEVLFEDGELGEPITCTGRRFVTTLRARLVPNKQLTLFAQARHALLDDSRGADKRQDLSALATALWKPDDRLRVRGRVRYLNEDIADPAYLEQSLETSVEVGYRMRKRDRARVRADLVLWLDDRASTAARSPSPELWLGADYEARF